MQMVLGGLKKLGGVAFANSIQIWAYLNSFKCELTLSIFLRKP